MRHPYRPCGFTTRHFDTGSNGTAFRASLGVVNLGQVVPKNAGDNLQVEPDHDLKPNERKHKRQSDVGDQFRNGFLDCLCFFLEFLELQENSPTSMGTLSLPILLGQDCIGNIDPEGIFWGIFKGKSGPPHAAGTGGSGHPESAPSG